MSSPTLFAHSHRIVLIYLSGLIFENVFVNSGLSAIMFRKLSLAFIVTFYSSSKVGGLVYDVYFCLG